MTTPSRIEIIDKVVTEFLRRTSSSAPAATWQKEGHSKRLEATIQSCLRGKPRTAFNIFSEARRDSIAHETKLTGRELDGELGALWIDECHMQTPLIKHVTAIAKLEAFHCEKTTKKPKKKKADRQPPEDPAQMLVRELVDNLQSLSLSVRGKKPDLIARLMEARRPQA